MVCFWAAVTVPQGRFLVFESRLEWKSLDTFCERVPNTDFDQHENRGGRNNGHCSGIEKNEKKEKNALNASNRTVTNKP